MSLSGIAIAIGTMVDMGIIVSENIQKHLSKKKKNSYSYKVIFTAVSEVAGAITTSILTTVISFLPLFTMTGAEGKLFIPLAWTKTFALISSLFISLTIIPVLAQLIFTPTNFTQRYKFIINVFYLILSLMGLIFIHFWIGLLLAIIFLAKLSEVFLSSLAGAIIKKWVHFITIAMAVMILTKEWHPLGYSHSYLVNLFFVIFVFVIILGFFKFFHQSYPQILRYFMANKSHFWFIPWAILIFSLIIWLGFVKIFPFVLLTCWIWFFFKFKTH